MAVVCRPLLMSTALLYSACPSAIQNRASGKARRLGNVNHSNVEMRNASLYDSHTMLQGNVTELCCYGFYGTPCMLTTLTFGRGESLSANLCPRRIVRQPGSAHCS